MKPLPSFFRCVLLGPPGAGKGNIAKRMVIRYGLTHCSTTEILRENVDNRTEFGKECETYLHKGDLVPDNLISKIMHAVLDGVTDQNWLMEGYPRTIHQAKQLHDWHPPNCVISIHVPFDDLVERLKTSTVQRPAGQVYSATWDPPSIKRLSYADDGTGESLAQRESANPDKIRQRLEAYVFWSRRVADFYKELGIMESFTGDKTEELWSQIDQFLKDRLEAINESANANASS